MSSARRSQHSQPRGVEGWGMDTLGQVAMWLVVTYPAVVLYMVLVEGKHMRLR